MKDVAILKPYNIYEALLREQCESIVYISYGIHPFNNA